MSLLLIGNIVSEYEDVNPTTESAAVCLKGMQKHNSMCLGHNLDQLVLSRIVQNIQIRDGF